MGKWRSLEMLWIDVRDLAGPMFGLALGCGGCIVIVGAALLVVVVATRAVLGL